MVIGVSGVAGAGKDFFVQTCMDELSKQKKTSKKFAIAAALKSEVRDWCLKHYGIDPVNCSREDKEKIRSFLVSHGVTKRHATQGRYWVEQLLPLINKEKPNYNYLFISDVRYDDYPKDEVHWVKEELKGCLVHLSQYKIKEVVSVARPILKETRPIFKEPANEEEERNEPKLKSKADYEMAWEFKINPDDEYISSKALKFIEWLSSYKE